MATGSSPQAEEPKVALTFSEVFTPSELLEASFLYLPMQDLLLVQRVSRRWKDVIAFSPALIAAIVVLQSLCLTASGLESFACNTNSAILCLPPHPSRCSKSSWVEERKKTF